MTVLIYNLKTAQSFLNAYISDKGQMRYKKCSTDLIHNLSDYISQVKKRKTTWGVL